LVTVGWLRLVTVTLGYVWLVGLRLVYTFYWFALLVAFTVGWVTLVVVVARYVGWVGYVPHVGWFTLDLRYTLVTFYVVTRFTLVYAHPLLVVTLLFGYCTCWLVPFGYGYHVRSAVTHRYTRTRTRLRWVVTVGCTGWLRTTLRLRSRYTRLRYPRWVICCCVGYVLVVTCGYTFIGWLLLRTVGWIPLVVGYVWLLTFIYV